MRKHVFLFFLCFLLIGSLMSFTAYGKSFESPRLPEEFFDGPEPIDGTYMLGPKEEAVRQRAAVYGPMFGLRTQTFGIEKPVEIGDEITVNVSDIGLGASYDEIFKVALIGTHGIILVTKDAYESFDGVYYRFANPYGDGSSKWLRTEDLLSTGQLSYLLSEFDSNIYPKDTAVFGEPLPRGTEGQKVWVLLHNIRDDAYYDPDTTTYVAGYFSASEDTENNKNMMHIDTYNWEDRIGPDAERPFLYEGVFAHEFEHLIHFDQDPDEPSWVDEGCADLAGYICGYGHPSRHVLYYLALHPITPLTFWGGGLQDYGASYLFTLYLYEKFGGEAFISDLVAEQANGIEGIENSLRDYGHTLTFTEIFDNWTVANYIDDNQLADGRFGYETLEIGSESTGGYTIQKALEVIWGHPFNIVPFKIASDWTGVEPKPYTAEYSVFYSNRVAELFVEGDEFAGVLPYSGNFEWYSGAEVWAWRGIQQSFDIPVGGATLTFYTYYEIEDDWDYGYVEVYDRTTGEWYTLQAPGITTSTLPFPQDNPNVPAEREPSDYFKKGRWNAFTGSSDGWIQVTMDLSPFAGHTIDLNFRTWQDGAFTLQMMYVDDISIPEIGFFDDVENAQHNWSVDGWIRSDGKFRNSLGAITLSTFEVQSFEDLEYLEDFVDDTDFIEEEALFYLDDPEDLFGIQEGEELLYSILRTRIDPATQKGRSFIWPAPVGSRFRHIMIITNHADHIVPSHHEFRTKLLSWEWDDD